MRKRYTSEDRQRFLVELGRSGDGVRVVAGRLGIDLSTAYRWKQKAPERTKASVVPAFARLVPTSAIRPGSLVVHVGGAEIRVEAGFDAELLRAVVAALGNSSP